MKKMGTLAFQMASFNVENSIDKDIIGAGQASILSTMKQTNKHVTLNTDLSLTTRT